MLEAVFGNVYKTQAVRLCGGKATVLVGSATGTGVGTRQQLGGSVTPVSPLGVRMIGKASGRSRTKEQGDRAVSPFTARTGRHVT